MQLKSLELHGYKTFASQTTFEFAGMITAIVGPNGSGKSNVADSLRWVLGEQSYSLLRGKKTEDMIFAGSEQRPRAGMASATVVFDNTLGWLPIDFSEVAITRRAYRDGQNEYLVNGQRVRLKDVTELLAQSGLAERTYTIIGQGVVDAALSLKAEERRRLFEEAAGIGLYRARREEALRRLDTTQRNLERVQDILAELQPRLSSLERQARRAKEYEQVRADLRLLLREWYGFHWHQAQRDLSEGRQAARKEEINLERVRRGFDQLDQQMAQGRARLGDLRARLNGWHRQMAALHTQREELSTQRAVEEERRRSIVESEQSLQAEIARLEEEQGIAQERYRVTEEEVIHLQDELEEARLQAQDALQSLQDRQNERQAAEAQVQSARQAVAILNRQQGEYQARLLERGSQVERHRVELEESRLALENTQRQVQQAKERLYSIEIEHDQCLENRRRAEAALQSGRQRRQEAEATRARLAEEHRKKVNSLARLKTQLDVIEQAEAALSGYARGAQALLKAARGGRLEGARGALGSFLEVPPELVPAVAAALGEFLDALVLDHSAGIEMGLSILEQEAARGVLVPLGSVTARPALTSIKDEDGLLGVASRLVKSPEEMRQAIDLLLGHTLIVRDRAAAVRVLDHHRRIDGLRVVTLKGEVFHASGPVQAGGETAQAALVRPRQRRELESEIRDIEEGLAALDRELAVLDKTLKDVGEEETRLEGEVSGARVAETTAQTSHRQQELAIESLQRQAKWHTERVTRLQTENQTFVQEAARFEQQLKQLEQQLVEARQAVHGAESRLNDLSLDEAQSQSAYWNTRVAVAERALADAQNSQAERQAAVQHARHAQEESERRLQELESALDSLDAEKVGRRQQEGAVNEQIEALSTLIDPAEAELAELESQQEDVQAKEAMARQELSKAEHHHAQARIALARRQEALETWKRRIEDDFGLVAFEYAEEVSGPTPLPLDGMVELLPRVRQLSPDLEENMRRLRAQLRRMGAINPEAQVEYQEVKLRFGFMTEQVHDLKKAEEDVHQVIAELDELMQRELRRTYEAVANEFSALFTRLFGGGSARLLLTDPDDMTVTGIDIEARLPGKRMQGLSLLSGGERSLTATALIFSLLKVSPTPFCLLDEVDAMLDEANVGRFRDLLRELSQHTQFILVTHNRNTVQAADVIYGVTMGRDSSSQVISLKMDEVDRVVET